MYTFLKACYSPADILFVLILSVLIASAFIAFLSLAIHMILGAVQEVRDIKAKKAINTR
jgi:hypothetical protein